MKTKLLVALITLIVFSLIGWLMTVFLETKTALIGAAGGAVGFYLTFLIHNLRKQT